MALRYRVLLGVAAPEPGVLRLQAAERYPGPGAAHSHRRGPAVGARLLGYDFTELALRFGLERSYRAWARQAPDLRRRIELVDLATNVRPGPWS